MDAKINKKPPIAGSPCNKGDSKTGERKYMEDIPSINKIFTLILLVKYLTRRKNITKEEMKYTKYIDIINAKRELLNTPNICNGNIIEGL